MPPPPRRQLRIGSPGSERPEHTFRDTFALSLLIIAVGFALILPAVFIGPAAPIDPRRGLSTEQLVELEERELLQASRDLAALTPDVLNVHVFSPLERRAALQHGPRLSAELVCAQLFAQHESIEENKREELREQLARALSERSASAPRLCLVAELLKGTFALTERDALTDEIERYWRDLLAFKTSSEQDAVVIDGLRRAGRLPTDREPLNRWLRRCAMRVESSAWPSCVAAVASMSPRQGSDLLDMIEVHLSSRSDLPEEELLEAVGLLERLGAQGSPPAWRIAQHPRLTAYDYDLRLASLFQLCRWTMTPARGVAHAASRALGEAFGSTLPAGDETLLRVRDACRVLFSGKPHDVEIASVPLLVDNRVPALTVLDQSMQDRPRYSFESLGERGECPKRQGYPMWYCGAEIWRGKGGDPAEALEAAYYNTRYVTWAPKRDLPELDAWLLHDEIVAQQRAPDQNANP